MVTKGMITKLGEIVVDRKNDFKNIAHPQALFLAQELIQSCRKLGVG